MENEKDLVVFENEDGNQIQMEVVDYLFYEGKEYALLVEFDENDQCEECESLDSDACEGCDNRREAIVMEVVPVDDDMEEFVPIDEELGLKLFEIITNSDYDDDEYEEEDGE